MTESKITTVAPAPKPIQAFISTATPEQRLGYLTQGEPQCISFETMRNGDFVTVYRPGLRGIIVGKEVDGPEAAVAAAAQTLAEFMTEPRVNVDEVALGIDTEGYDISQTFSNIGCRLESIFHIGAMITDNDLPDELEEFLDGLTHTSPSPIFDDLPFLRKLTKENEDEVSEIFTEICHDEGVYGFIVAVSIPEHRPYKGGGASVHMGIRHIEYRYATTFKVACERAAEWAKAEYDRMMAVPADS